MKSKNTKATDLAFDRVIELLLADEAEYPNDTVLVPADIPDFDRVMAKRRLRDKPILVIYPDGGERLIEPTDATR